jgi:hypothetical protein
MEDVGDDASIALLQRSTFFVRFSAQRVFLSYSTVLRV